MSRPRAPVGLPVIPAGREVPLYEGDIEADIRTMNRKRAEEIGGRLSYPSKMDVASWGIPATRCRIGSVLARQEGTTCGDCYALKGSFRFKGVRDVLEGNYERLFNPLWTPAMAAQWRWLGEDRARLFLAGDIQGVNHLLNIIRMCNAVPGTVFWMPSREVATILTVKRMLVETCLEWPTNLIDRVSASLVDGPPPRGFVYTSTVVTKATPDTCPSSIRGGSCADNGCTRCWHEEGDVPYLKH